MSYARRNRANSIVEKAIFIKCTHVCPTIKRAKLFLVKPSVPRREIILSPKLPEIATVRFANIFLSILFLAHKRQIKPAVVTFNSIRHANCFFAQKKWFFSKTTIMTNLITFLSEVPNRPEIESDYKSWESREMQLKICYLPESILSNILRKLQ